jgi:hypothetical protein
VNVARLGHKPRTRLLSNCLIWPKVTQSGDCGASGRPHSSPRTRHNVKRFPMPARKGNCAYCHETVPRRLPVDAHQWTSVRHVRVKARSTSMLGSSVPRTADFIRSLAMVLESNNCLHQPQPSHIMERAFCRFTCRRSQGKIRTGRGTAQFRVRTESSQPHKSELIVRYRSRS